MLLKNPWFRRSQTLAGLVAATATLTLIGALSPVMAEDAPAPDPAAATTDAEPAPGATDAQKTPDTAPDAGDASKSDSPTPSAGQDSTSGDDPAAGTQSDASDSSQDSSAPAARMSMFAPLALPATQVSIGDRVWLDANRNGQQDVGEVGIKDVTLKLYAGNSTATSPIATTTTDTAGKYAFTDLTPDAEYTIAVSKPAGYAFTTANVGADATDSDVSSDGGYTFNAPATGLNNDGTPDDASIDAGLQTTVPCVGGPSPVVGGFEIDGNVCAQGLLDWANTGVSVDDGFGDSGGFTKGAAENTNPASWTLGNTPNDKTDIGTAYAYSHVSNGHVFGFFALTNASTSGGTSQYDLEYNQLANVKNANGVLVPQRSPGDLLFRFASTGSDAIAFTDAKIYTLTSASSWKNGSCFLVNGASPAAGWCTIPIPAHTFASSVNADGSFFEGAIDLTVLFGLGGSCSGTFGATQVRSVTGNSFDTSSLKDYVLPLNLTTPSTCSTLVINKFDQGTTPLGGATFTIAPNPLGGNGALSVKDNDVNDADPAAGVIKIKDVQPGGYTVTETDPPAGYLFPAQRSQTLTVGQSATATFTFNDPKSWAAPTVTKTAVGKYDATYSWKIDKSVRNNPDGTYGASARQDLAAGTNASFGYKIAVTQDKETRTNYRVTGALSVSNDNVDPMVVTLSDAAGAVSCTFPGVTDLDGDASNGMQVSLPGKATAGSPAKTTTYDYSCAMPDNAADGTNTATVSWDKNVYPQSQEDADKAAAKKADASKPGAGMGHATGIADYAFTEGTAVNKKITVTDDKQPFDPAWTITWGDPESNLSRTYSLSVLAPENTCTPAIVNTAKIVETGQTATATIKVCGGSDLVVEKNKTVSLTRSFGWDIQKTRTSAEKVDLDGNGQASAKYSVTVNRAAGDGYQDSGWLMSGKITVTNPNDWQDITLTGITDAYDGGGTCTVDQGVSLTIPKSGSRTFDYSCTFAQKPAYDGINTATITWDALTAHTTSGTDTGTKAVAQADWSKSLVNKVVTVTDPAYDDGHGGHVLGTVDWDQAPQTFTYTGQWSGQAGKCVTRTNTATIVETQQSASADVLVCAPMGLTATKSVTQAKKDRRYGWKVTKEIQDSDGTWKDTASWSGNDYAHDFDYQVKVEPQGFTDENYRLKGTITVTNPNIDDRIAPITATVSDTPDVGGGVTCLVEGKASYEVVLTSGKDAVLNYSCAFTGAPVDGKNLASVTWDGGSKAVSPRPEAAVAFGVDQQINKTVTVYDDYATGTTKKHTLGTATWQETKTFPVYAVNHVASGLDCAAPGNRFVNTASVFGDDALLPLDVDTATALICPNPGTWTVAKSSTPKDGTRIEPGTSITYHLSAHKTGGVNPANVVIIDDLSDLAGKATLPPTFTAPAGTTAAYDSQTKRLTWTISELTGTDQTLDITVTVNSDAWNVGLRNVITSEGSTNCSPTAAAPGAEECYTDHHTTAKPKLTLIKDVLDNGTGANDLASAWDLSADGPGTASDVAGVKSGTQTEVLPGVYALSEANGPAGYDKQGWKCDGDTAYRAVESITLASDQVATCTVTNLAVKPKLTLIKSLDKTNDPDARGTASDWHLTANTALTAGVELEGDGSATDTMAKVGSYDLSESPNASAPVGYDNGNNNTWVCKTPTDADATMTDKDTVTLGLGDNVTCTIVNKVTKGTWSRSKSSEPGDGETVKPGESIVYKLTATRNSGGSDPRNVILTDDLTDVLQHATYNGITDKDGKTTSTKPAGDVEFANNKLTWTIPTLSQTEVLYFKVTVNAGQWGATLNNSVGGDGPCLGDCDTVQYTPAYTLRKSSAPAEGTRVEPGTNVDYTLTVENTTSKATLTGAVVLDDLSKVVDHTSDPEIQSGVGASYANGLLTWNVPQLAPGAKATLVYRVQIDADAFGVTIGNVATPKTDTGGNCVAPTATDQKPCETTHTTKALPKLTLVKDVDNGTTNGDAAAKDFTLTASGPQTVSGPGEGQGQVKGADVKVGTYTLTESGPKHYTQGAWMCRDNDPQGDWTSAGDVGKAGSITLALDEDVTCMVRNTADDASYTVAKSSPTDQKTVLPGDTVTYTLTAKWRDGVRLTNVKVGDDLSKVLPFADGGVTAINASTGAASVTGDTLTWTIPELADADGLREATLTYQVKVRSDAWSSQLKNVVTPVTPGGTCEVGNDCQTVESTPDKPKLQLIKNVVNGVAPTATANDWILKAVPGAGVDQRQAELAGAGGIASTAVWPGSYSLAEVNNPAAGGETAGYTASAWQCRDRGAATANSGPTLSLEPGDDVVCEITNTQDAVWKVAKTNSAGSGNTVQPGDSITYTLTATHVAGVKPTGIEITDDLSQVTPYIETFDDTQLPAAAKRTGDKLVWKVPAFADGVTEQTLSYTVKVKATAIGVTLKNAITAPGSNCPPPDTFLALVAPGCTTSNPTPEWTLSKSSDPGTGAEVAPLSTITYTLHTKNTSDAVLKDATVVDDLSGVLTGATLNQPLAAGLTLEGTNLTWAVPTLEPGQEATTSYSVTMTIPAQSGGMIVNVAAPVQPTGHCEADDACSTTHVQNPAPLPPVNPPAPPVTPTPPVVLPPASPPQAAPPAALPNTGGPRLVYLPSGIGLLLLGLGLMLVERRRKVEDPAVS